MHEKLWITKDNLASCVLILFKCVIKYCTFLHIVVPSSEAGGLAHGILHAKELLLVRVLVGIRDGHWSSEVGLQDVILAKENLSLLIDALDLPRVHARRLPTLTTSNPE